MSLNNGADQPEKNGNTGGQLNAENPSAELAASDSFRDFQDRDEISSSIHLRAPLECAPLGRAMKLIIAYPSLKDRVRFHLDQHDFADDGLILSGEKKLAELVEIVGQPFGAPPTRILPTWELCPEFRIVERALRVALEKASGKSSDSYQSNFRTSSYELQPREWISEVGKTLQQRKFENINEIDWDNDSSFSSCEIHSAESKDGYRMRLRWDGFSHNHSLQIIEDIATSTRDDIEQFTKDAVSDPTEAFSQKPVFQSFSEFRFDAFTSLAEALWPADGAHEACDCSDRLFCTRAKRPADCLRGLGRARLAREASGAAPEGQPPAGLLICADYWLQPIEIFLAKYWSTNEFKKLREVFDQPSLIPKREPIKAAAEALRAYAAASAFKERHIDERNNSSSAGGKPRTLSDKETKVAIATIRAIANWMTAWFKIGGKAPQSRFREDFVFSFFSDGRGILISDLRPDENKADERYYHDGQTRTVIIDLGMYREERGRMLQRLMDLAAFRHLSLRDHPYIRPATNALTQIGVALSDVNLSADNESDEDSDKVLDEILNRVRGLSRALDLLNLFFTYGVTGKWNSTKGYAQQIETNLHLIRESRVPGFQTLNGYMDRYFTTMREIEYLNERYNTLRLRVAEASELLRARYDQKQLIKLNKSANVHTNVMIFAGIASFFAVVVSLIGVFRGGGLQEQNSTLQERLDQSIEYHDRVLRENTELNESLENLLKQVGPQLNDGVEDIQSNGNNKPDEKKE